MLVNDNKYIPSEDRDFFILLRIGLWQRVDEELSSAPDWNYIYKLAEEQTVLGIVSDGMEIYSKSYSELDITSKERDCFINASAQIFRRNIEVNQLQAKICKLFNEQNIKYVILKGQGVAQCYPKPLLRCSGDIDILCNEQHYSQAIDLLISVSDSNNIHDGTQRNADFFFGELQVELHLDEFDRIGNRDEFASIRELMFDGGSFSSYNSNGQKIFLAPVSFDCFYVFLHFVKHYYNEGLGLRQITDWAMYLTRNHQIVDDLILQNYLKDFNVEREWQIFANFAYDFLSLSKEDIPLFNLNCTTNQSNQNRIWQYIKQGGNMGHKIDKEIYGSFFVRNKSRLINIYDIYKRNSVVSFPKAIKLAFNQLCDLL